MVSGIPKRHLALGLLIREIVAPFTGHRYDFEIWVRLGYYMQSLGTPYRDLAFVPGVSFAPPNLIGSISYFPLPAFIFGLTFKLYSLLGEPSRFLYYFLLKQPMVLSDGGIAVMLGKLIPLLGGTRPARTVGLVWLYLPFTIIVSSVWGALDPIALFLVLASLYLFLTVKFFSSAMLLGLSIFLKTIPIVFLPAMLNHSGMTPAARVRYAVLSLFVPFAGTVIPAEFLGWGFNGPVDNFFPQVSVNRYGAMSVLYPLSFIPTPSLLLILDGLVWVPVLIGTWLYISRRNVGFIEGLAFSVLAFIISRPFLPEQWAVYPLALLLMVRGRSGLDHFIGLTTIATAFLFVNNTLLIQFLQPILPSALGWSEVIIDGMGLALPATLFGLAVLFFTDSCLFLSGRNSLAHYLFPEGFKLRGPPLGTLVERLSPEVDR